MNQPEASRFLKRFYRVLRQDEVCIKLVKDLKYDKPKPISGLWDPTQGKRAEVSLNPNKRRYGGIVSTLIHELLHQIEYNRSHKWIFEKEKEIYNALSDRQLTNLLGRAFK